jgi:hypothetical protein
MPDASFAPGASVDAGEGPGAGDPRPGRAGLTRFILLNAARTGSSMLATKLDSHPDIRCHGEVLGPGPGKAGDRLVGLNYGTDPTLERRLVALRDSDPVRFLSEWVYRAETGAAAGFKIKYEELLKADFERVLGWLVAEESIKVIHLVRRNRLKRLVSEITATRFYGAYQIRDASKAPPVPRFRLTAEECRADFDKQERRERRFGRMFGDHDVFDTSYEDLVDPAAGALHEVQAFLGVKPVELRTATRKMNPDELRVMIENYDELEAAFEDTPYAAYFAASP